MNLEILRREPAFKPRLDVIVLLLRGMPQTSTFMFCEDCMRVVDTSRQGNVIVAGNNERCRGMMVERSRDDLIQLLGRQ